MSAAVAGLVAAPMGRRAELAFTISLLLGETILLIILAKLLPRVIAYDGGETLSVWAVGGTLLLGFLVSRWLARAELSMSRRFWYGLFTTLIALQVIGSIDLSESARFWNMSWVLELGRPSSPIWREAITLADGSTVPGDFDQFIAALTLVPIWFRGVALGSDTLFERTFSRYAVGGLVLIAISLALADNGGVVDHVRALSLVWVVVGLVTVALRTAASSDQVRGLGAVQTGASIAVTLGALIIGVAIFLLLVTGVVGLVAGSGVVDPVLDAIGIVLRAIITAISYILWPLFWLVTELREVLAPETPTQIEQIGEGFGGPVDEPEAEPQVSDNTPGIVLVRVFGGIGALLVFALLVFYLFRRFVRRDPGLEEERESLWGEADLLGDLTAGLRGLGDRFRRRRDQRTPDAPIAELYFDVLDHAERRGQIRAIHRTPLQFAEALERAYRSPTPRRISSAFSTFRYGGRPPSEAELNSMQQSWDSLKDGPS